MQTSWVFLVVIGFASVAAVDIGSLEELEKAKKENATHYRIRNLHVPAGRTLELEKLPAGSTIEFLGRVTFGYKEWKGYLIIIKGDRFKVVGRPGHVIDGEGQRWWDGVGGNGGKNKPGFIYVQLKNSKVNGLHVKNCPRHCFAINDSHYTIFNGLTIDNALGHTKGGHNTDGFDVDKSSHVRIINSKVNNQDDCLAINSGKHILFQNNVCEGGHGIAVAVGGYSVNEARNIVIKDCKVIKNNIGIRVKTHLNGHGVVEDVTFENVELRDISQTGIVIIGNYLNSGPRGDPTPGLPIKRLKIKNVHGNVLTNGTNIQVWVANASDWSWDSNVRGGTYRLPAGCKGIPKGVNIKCG